MRIKQMARKRWLKAGVADPMAQSGSGFEMETDDAIWPQTKWRFKKFPTISQNLN
jgi:hypothetical protein